MERSDFSRKEGVESSEGFSALVGIASEAEASTFCEVRGNFALEGIMRCVCYERFEGLSCSCLQRKLFQIPLRVSADPGCMPSGQISCIFGASRERLGPNAGSQPSRRGNDVPFDQNSEAIAAAFSKAVALLIVS